MKVSPELYEKLVGKSKENKYHNIKTTYDDITFDSIKEKSYYIKFKLMEKAGEIRNLELQKEFTLIEPFELYGKKYRKTSYLADFVYQDGEGKTHVVDIKSPATRTKVYQLKKKMMAYIHKIEIEEL